MTDPKSPDENAVADAADMDDTAKNDIGSTVADAADAATDVAADADIEAVTDDFEQQDLMADELDAAAPATPAGDEPVPDGDTPSDEATAAQEPSQQPPPAKPRGRVLGALALLLALAAAAGVGYLYYHLIYLAPLSEVAARSAEMDARYTDLESRLTEEMAAVSQASSDAVSDLAAAQAERLAENEAAVVRSLNEALLAAPPSQREWKLAEAEYLMRIANHRVLMEQDSDGALDLLMAADRIIAELDDFALHQVRARLADEIIALEQVRRDDLQGIYLRLEALKAQLADLPLATPTYLEQVTEEPEEERTVWQTMAEELKQFVRIREVGTGEAIRPLLAPEEERYLELNLRLAVEQAQLAALRRQQAVFEQSLTSVRGWFVGYMNPDDERTRAVLETVDGLLALELARPLPDISGSLNELLSIAGGSS